MNKNYIIVVVIIIAIVGGYIILNPNGNDGHHFTKGISVFKNKVRSTAKGYGEEPKIQELVEKIAVKINGCAAALSKFEQDVDCLEKPIMYAGKEAAIVYMKGAEQENAIALPDGRVIPLSIGLYFDSSEAIINYVKRIDKLEITADDISGATEELRIGKRGYLYSLKFNNTFNGTIYITPKGRLSGHLKK